MISRGGSIILAVALIIFGFFVGRGLQKFNRQERTISVRGLAEKEVQANVAVWKIHYNVSSDRIEQVRKELPEVQSALQDFLTRQGFATEEISKTSSIKDRQAQEYGAEKGNRYVASGMYMVTTSKVEKIQQAREHVDELVKKGIVVTNDQLDFFFTNLNQIKPEMLDQATQNAKQAAQGFAKSMDVEVGKLKSANQGVFSIDNPIGSSGADNDYGGGSQSSLVKKVRVVTQVEFYID